MSNPGPGVLYRHCVTCKRPFRLWHSRIQRGAKFCSVRCFHAALAAFHEALAAGELEGILQLPASREALKRR